MEISQLLIDKYGFQKYFPDKHAKVNINKWDCVRRIHVLHYLYYSDTYKHFEIAVFNEDKKGNPGGGIDDWSQKVMIPRAIYNENDVIEILKAFKINEL